jgi:4'-phosphopantetheinyl transferase
VYRHKNLDFRENLRLQDFRMETAGCFEGRVFTGSFDRTYELHYELHPAFVLTYVLAPLEPEQRDL